MFRSDGIEIVRTPFRAPQATAWRSGLCAPSARKCLDWLLILNQQHLERILEVFVDHYNGHRPHRALSLAPPEGRRPVNVQSAFSDARMLRRDRSAVSFKSMRLQRDELFEPYREHWT